VVIGPDPQAVTVLKANPVTSEKGTLMSLLAVINSRAQVTVVCEATVKSLEHLALAYNLTGRDLDPVIWDRCEDTAAQLFREQGPLLDMPFEDLQDLAYTTACGFGADVIGRDLQARIAFLLAEFTYPTVRHLILETAGVDA
jgi:hypothetical protein